MARQTYNNAEKIDGLLGRDLFMPAFHAYAASHPDVPDHLVPKQVAKLMNPALNADSSGIRSPATRIA